MIPDPELSHSGHRLTVDEQADYEMMSHLYDALYQPGRPIPLGEAVRYLDQHPEIAALNEEVQQTPLPEKDVHFVK
ncbi:hypothetical protein BOW51_07150 [Solemya velesiana gill symbiont]|uniref:Uncharacterized protein n=1 Tax=Solemya velesiana gill symbiont TaxID=1918948 RepID=A0A1T2KUN1_9GAMM|nr:hypothetical protein BOW51_07150 [Solemya velesiana gill symbiont]